MYVFQQLELALVVLYLSIKMYSCTCTYCTCLHACVLCMCLSAYSLINCLFTILINAPLFMHFRVPKIEVGTHKVGSTGFVVPTLDAV